MLRYRPGPPLDAVVDCLWWHQRPHATTTVEHLLPTGTVQLVVALHGEPISWSAGRGGAWHAWTGGIVHGPQSSFYVAGPKPRGAVVGASFRPGAAGAILGLPVDELMNQHVTVEAVWGVHGRLLHEQLAQAPTPEAALAGLEAALFARLRAPLLIHPAVAAALRRSRLEAPDTLRAADLRRDSGYSPKHFIALFRAAVGLTPKQYLRVMRFSSVVERLAGAAPAGALAEIAAENGYADQSHLSREFRELAGITPRTYRPSAPTSPHHHVAAELGVGGR